MKEKIATVIAAAKERFAKIARPGGQTLDEIAKEIGLTNLAVVFNDGVPYRQILAHGISGEYAESLGMRRQEGSNGFDLCVNIRRGGEEKTAYAVRYNQVAPGIFRQAGAECLVDTGDKNNLPRMGDKSISAVVKKATGISC